MKLTVLIVACMASVAVHTASVQNDLTVDKAFLERQRFVFEVLLRVSDDLQSEEWIKLGGKLNNDNSLYTTYTEWMVKFYDFFRVGGLLPRGEFFSASQRIHAIQAKGLFDLFYYAKDWNTLVENIVWARLNVNEGIFVYAITLAVIHRPDMQGLILPQIYEIFPQLFFNSKLILEAEKFNWDTFNRQIMLEKEFKTIYEQDQTSEIFGNRFYQMDWKTWQWWKLMGLDDGWQVEAQYPLREDVQLLVKDPMWANIYGNLKMAYLPVDYSRDIGIYNDESILSYFTEDIGWNSYWYYLNMDYARIIPSNEFNLDQDRRGEWWLYNVQQILARYYMERLAQGLGSIDMLDWDGYVQTGYNPQLISYSGSSFTVRKNYYEIESQHNLGLMYKVQNLESRIYDIINAGKFVMRNGTVIDLTNPESVEIIGAILQSNYDVTDLDYTFLGWWSYFTKMFLSGEQYHGSSIAPHAIMNFETMLRDPLSYSLYKIAANIYYQFLYQLAPYKKEELSLPGVNITDVEVSKLVTYFDLFDTDITTLLNDKIVYHDGKLVWDKVLLARQMRLNHEPFTFDLQVSAEKAQKVVIRMFLGPQFDQYGQKINLFTHRENFLELDEFIYELVDGQNTIHRSSEDFQWTSGDQHTYSELYNYLMMSYDGQYQFLQNISSAHSLFPDRLILPHGWVEGMPMILFFMVSPYTAEFEQYSSYDPSWQAGIGSGVRHIDNKPFGYPFDRKIDNAYEFLVPNMFFKNVKIYHLEKLDKYFPFKYDNYGSFDYDY